MRRLLPLLLVLVAVAAPAVDVSRVPAVLREARARLRGGMPMLAAEAARRCLAELPRDLRCVEVLGRATAATGNCEEAFPALRRVRAEGAWDADTAIAEGVCHVRVGDLDTARVVFEEAARLDPDSVDAWLQRGLVDAQLGDPDGLDEALDALVERGAAAWKVELLGLWQASLAPGEGIDGLLWSYLVEPPQGVGPAAGLVIHVGLVACERSLAVGDPQAALDGSERGLSASRGHLRVRACRAEAHRRLGDAELVLQLTSRPWDDWRATPVLDAVRARALVDLDRVDEARAVLAEVGHPEQPDVLVSAWYVARAWGDLRAMRRAETLLAARAPRALALLDQLDPLDRSAP